MDNASRTPSRRAVVAFVVLAAVYHAVYFVVFAARVAGYWADVLRHFPFARRLFG